MLKVLCLVLLATYTVVNGQEEDASEGVTEGIDYTEARLRPGVKIRFTQKGLDFGARVAMDLMMEEMEGLAIPDIQASAAGSSISMTNMRIVSFPRPISYIRTVPDQGLVWATRDVNLQLEADFELKVKVVWWTMTKRGSITADGRDLMFTLAFNVGRDNIGRPMPYGIECNAIGNEIDISFQGGLSSVFNFAFNAFKGTIKDAIKAQLCAKAEEEIGKLTPKLASLPVTVTVDRDYEINYGLTRFPTFKREYLETHHKGAIYLKGNHTDPHIVPPIIPDHPEHIERMLYVYVTDFVMNTGFDAAYDSGKLAYSVSEDMLPQEARTFLSTACAALCIGTVFPQLEERFGSTKALVDVFATRAPVGRISGDEVQVTGWGAADFYIKPNGQRTDLFSINMTVAASVKIGTVGNKVIFNVTNITPKANVKATHIGDIGDGFLFETVLRIASKQFLLPKLRELGSNGIELPNISDLRLVNAQVIDHDTENVFIVATDVEYHAAPTSESIVQQ